DRPVADPEVDLRVTVELLADLEELALVALLGRVPGSGDGQHQEPVEQAQRQVPDQALGGSFFRHRGFPDDRRTGDGGNGGAGKKLRAILSNQVTCTSTSMGPPADS